MPSRLTLAAGILGVASLAFVGVGGYAAFTSNVNLDTSATAGTFILNAVDGTTGQTCAADNQEQPCSFWDAGNAPSNKGTLSVLNNSNITPDGSNATAKWTIPNMAPGDAYFAEFYVTDAGSLQGQVSEVTYTLPTLGTSQYQLVSDMTVTVQEKTPEGWINLPRMDNAGHAGSGNLPANTSYTFSTAVSGGNVPSLQPLNTSTDENSAEFRVIYTLSDSTSNGVEAVSVTPQLSFVGTSMP